MQISDEDASEFRELYAKEFNDNITIEEARHIASQVLELYMQLARPLPEEEEITSTDNHLSL